MGRQDGTCKAVNYDVTVFEQEYLEMINHWEIVYRKGTENDRKQL